VTSRSSLQYALAIVAILLCISGHRAAAASSQVQAPPASGGPVVVVDSGQPVVRLAVADGQDIRFARISRTQGLSQTRVEKIVQDDLGFIWFGTQYGLNRYDGYRFKVFVHDDKDPESLGGVDIFSLFKDHSGTLWIGCAHSLDRFDSRTSTFEHYRVDTEQPGQPDLTVRHISEDRSGTLWLSTAVGLYSLDPTSRRTLKYHHDQDDTASLASDYIKFTGTDRRGDFWVADSEGLEQFDPRQARVKLRIPLPESRDLSFYEDRTGTFWLLFASGNGLATFDRDTRQLTRYSFNGQETPGGPLTGAISMVEDGAGTLWVGTLSDGLLQFDKNRRAVVRYTNHPADPESLAENRITVLYADRGGNIWTGLGASEPNLFATRQPGFKPLPADPETYANLGEALVNCLYEDHSGYLWIGMTGVLKRLDRKTGQYTHFAIPQHGIASDVISLVEDAEGFLWIGTSGQGLYRLDPATGRTQSFRHTPSDPTSLSNDVVQRLYIDHTGTLWATTWDGFDRYDAARGTFKTYRSDARDHNVAMPIAEDSSGHLWLGTAIPGLLRFDPVSGQFQSFEYAANPAASTGSDKTNTIHIAGPEAIWSGTQNGLYRLNPRTGQIAAYSSKDGLPGNAVSCILDDRRGNLWISTNEGIASFNQATRTFKQYSAADGLPGHDLTGWWACFRSHSGEMFFGGFHGATAFYPDQIVADAYAPPVVLTGFQLSGPAVDPNRQLLLDRSIAYTAQHTLSFGENSFSIEFSALSFRSPATNRYRYLLKGLDSTWHEVRSDRRVASYTTLPPGDYEFRVQGATSRGPWSEPGVAVRLVILPPWWQTWWFYAAVCCLLILALFAAYQRRLRQLDRLFEVRLEERTSERTRIARELHDSLLQGFQGLMFRLQAVRGMLPGRPGDAERALDVALDKADEAIAEGRDTVQDLRSSVLVESNLVAAIAAMGQEIAASATGEAAPSFRVIVEGEERSLDLTVRDEVYRIVREAARNAFRHASARAIEVEISYGDSQFSARVRDDGIGLDPNIVDRGQRTGHWGLPGMRERAESFGGNLNVWSERGAGTEVEVSIPGQIAYAKKRTSYPFWAAK
jgi:signal transduction histidine kinase/ligand-binding sensor domain-containing protein